MHYNTLFILYTFHYWIIPNHIKYLKPIYCQKINYFKLYSVKLNTYFNI